jgi:hypothetical protein
MRTIFNVVRQRQDRVSRNNALRRDADQDRHHVIFNKDDPVLLYEPDVTSATGTTEREPIATHEKMNALRVPRKWKMPWSGPHIITRQTRDNVYEFFHNNRQRIETANVDRLTMYHPFKDISHLVPSIIAPATDVVINADPVLQYGYGPDHLHLLKAGDLCLTVVPGNKQEPITVMRYLRDLPDGSVELQWLGSLPLLWYIDVRMQKQHWRSGWYEPNTKQYYWRRQPFKNTLDVAFTNVLSEERIGKEDIFFFGFTLMADHRLTGDTARIALAKYRDLNTDGIDTYELDKPSSVQ